MPPSLRPYSSTNLSLRKLSGTQAEAILSIELVPGEAERFLGPIDDIVAAARTHPFMCLHALDRNGVVVAFLAVHPDLHDPSCWWLAWLAVGVAARGEGLGRAMLRSALRRLSVIPGCRRIRLHVAPDNPARHLYEQEGFTAIGMTVDGEKVMQARPGRLLCVEEEKPRCTGRRATPRRLRAAPGPHAARCVAATRGPPSHYVAKCQFNY